MAKERIAFFGRDYKALIILLALGLVMRGVFFGAILWNHGPQGFALPANEDAGEYVAIAKNLTEHGVFSRDPVPPFSPEQLRTPGYPLLLAFFYKLIPTLPFLAAAQNIFFLIGIVLVYKIALLLGTRKGTALLAAGFLAFEPTTIYWNNQLTTESAFTVFLLAGTYCFILFFRNSSVRLLAYAGFFLGYAFLIRPIAQYLGVIFLVTFLIMGLAEKRSLRTMCSAAALLIVGFIVTAAPWMWRNQTLFGSAAPTPMVVAYGKYLSAMQSELGVSVDFANYGGIPRDKFEQSELVRQETIRTIARHPLLFAKIHLAGLVPFFLGDGYVAVFGTIFPALGEMRLITNWTGSPAQLVSFIAGHRGIEAIVFWSGKFVWLTITAFAIFGFARIVRGRERRYAILILAIIYYFALASGVGSYSRFRFPVNPFLFLFAAVGITAVLPQHKDARRMDRSAAIG